MAQDRNQQARNEFAQQQQVAKMRREFAAALANGTAKLVDRIGQPIAEGDLVIYRPPHDFIYEVAEIKPILDPRVPPGWVELTLLCRVPVQFQVGPPVMNLVRIGHQQAPGHAQLDEPTGDAAQAASTPQQDETIVSVPRPDMDSEDPDDPTDPNH